MSQTIAGLAVVVSLAAAGLALGVSPPAPGEAVAVRSALVGDRSPSQQGTGIGTVSIHYTLRSDGTVSLQSSSGAGGYPHIVQSSLALVADKVKYTGTWSCAKIDYFGQGVDLCTTTSVVKATSMLQGSGNVTLTNAFGQTGPLSGSFSFTCRQVSSKGCDSAVGAK